MSDRAKAKIYSDPLLERRARVGALVAVLTIISVAADRPGWRPLQEVTGRTLARRQRLGDDERLAQQRLDNPFVRQVVDRSRTGQDDARRQHRPALHDPAS